MNRIIEEDAYSKRSSSHRASEITLHGHNRYCMHSIPIFYVHDSERSERRGGKVKREGRREQEERGDSSIVCLCFNSPVKHERRHG
jgi:hypothetical protein